MRLDTVASLEGMQEDCAEICLQAAEIAEWCADECIGSPEMAECARQCRDVADLATLHARFMARDSQWSDGLAKLCADACETCAETCRGFDAEHCKEAARVLAECARSCRQMGGH